MKENQGRRDWLRKSALAFAGLSLAGRAWSRPGSMEDLLYEEIGAGPVRIGQNENPYGPSPMARKAMTAAIDRSNRYPGEMATALREKLGQQYGLTADHVLLGAGSSELLGNTAALAGQQRGNAVTADPTFRLWFGAAEHFGLTIKKVSLTAAKVHDLDAMWQAMDSQTRMVYVVNPHNPTGTVVAASDLIAFAEKVTKQCYLLLDEAYTEYSDAVSLAPMVRENRNLVIAKTFSKIHGMAGARVGFLLAHPDTIKKLAQWQPWANASPSAMGMAGAMASLDDQDFLRMSRTQNDKVKKMVIQNLEQMGFPVIPSHTNFIYYDASSFKGDLAEVMQEANFSAIRIFEPGTGWRRTSLGTWEEMDQFLKVLKRKMG